MALAPLRQFGLKTTLVTTLQAISGAGYPGVPSWDILGNVIPVHRRRRRREDRNRDEEDSRLAGRRLGRAITRSRVSATTTRVPVHNGHTASMSVGLEQKPTPEAVIDAWTHVPRHGRRS